MKETVKPQMISIKSVNKTVYRFIECLQKNILLKQKSNSTFFKIITDVN